MEQYTLMGLIIALSGLAIKELFSWFKEKSLKRHEERLNGLEAKLSALFTQAKDHDDAHKISFAQISELYEWHDKDDQDGVKIWYVRQSLEVTMRETAKTIAILAKNSELQTRLLQELVESQRVISKEQTEMAKTLREIERSVDE